MPNFETVRTNGINLRVAVEGKGPAVIFVHGFPESWYSWRHQISAFAKAGFKAIAPDVRGYGGSDKPHDVNAYDMKSITADIAGLAAHYSPDSPAIVIGHDWGAPIAWYTTLLFPKQIRAVAALSVPYTGRPPAPFIEIAKKVYTENNKFFYQVYFQDEGVAEVELERDVYRSISLFMALSSGDPDRPDWLAKQHGSTLFEDMPPLKKLPSWLSEEDIAYYVNQFEQSGFRGPLNRYRTQHRDFDFISQLDDHTIYQPAFFIAGKQDPVINFIPGVDLIAQMRQHVPNLSDAVMLDNCGHWTQQEQAEQTNGLLLKWARAL